MLARDPCAAAGSVFARYEVSSDLNTILLAVDALQRWRHSITAMYYVFDVPAKAMRQLSPSRVSFAVFLNHRSVAFVEGNNLKIIDDVTPAASFPFEPRALTTDGSPTVFNGVPDWLYEEEILSSDRAV
jgi:hypothetical protein